MRATYAASSDEFRRRIEVDGGYPGAWPGAHRLRDTERFGRELNRPARVLADGEALQAATGPADRETFTTTSGDVVAGCMRNDERVWPAFARITQ